ncbi:MAG: hypothetical protein P4L10_01030 [Acidobacteriaceae bacterium]|nr:hypothetical protein [Acidobacteriaceae bacterium]
MNVPLRRAFSIPSIAPVLFTACALVLAGCGIGTIQNMPSDRSVPLVGVVHGGPNPVLSATVTLYATQSNGYGGAGLQLATTTTDSNGNFTFNPSSYTCPGGQQAYITVAGGNTGGNATNANSVLMAAVGPCSSLNSNTFILVNEPSTVAAAYALSNFIKISGTGSSTVVDVSAPANNNALTGSCTGTGTSMTCQAAGLAHAFLNAANLVNVVGTISSLPTGSVYSTPPSNSTASVSSSTSAALINQVPQQLINSLADSVETCVNSTGLTGAGDTTSACGKLFTAATVSSTYTSNTVYTTEPTNTLQALVNLAKFPFAGASAVFSVGTSNTYYQPTLTAAPVDWTIAIIYRSYGGGANEIGPTYYTTTDINDNVYATALTAAATGSETGTQPLIAHSLTSNGVGNWSAPATISTNTTNICTAWGGTAGTSAPCLAATDTAGHLWVALGSLSSGFTGGLWQVNTATGSVTQFNTTVSSTTFYPDAIAVDAANDVFFSTANTTGTADLWEMPSGSTSTTVPTPFAPGGTNFVVSHIPGSIVFDTAGNIFSSEDSGSGAGYLYAANTGTLSAEAFGTAVENANNGLSVTTPGIDSWPTGSMVDANGNFWIGGQHGLYEIPKSGVATNTGVTTYAIGSSTTTVLRISSMDGAGTIFVPDANTSASVNPAPPPTVTGQTLRIYYPALAAQASLAGCNVGTATGNTACITTNSGAPNNLLFFQAINAAIDSTGSMWVSSEGNDGVIQVIGTAAPTWPQASYLHPAVMPQ